MSDGARRRQLIAVVLSGVFPGLGQFYNRQHIKGIAFLVPGLVLTWLFGRVTPVDPRALARPGADLLVPLLALLGVWIWSVVDAWRAAGR
jgi:hypothetical protein